MFFLLAVNRDCSLVGGLASVLVGNGASCDDMGDVLGEELLLALLIIYCQ